jgi:hypothetical protein
MDRRIGKRFRINDFTLGEILCGESRIVEPYRCSKMYLANALSTSEEGKY